MAELEDSQHKPLKNSSSLIYNVSNCVSKRSTVYTDGSSQRGKECGKEGVRKRMREGEGQGGHPLYLPRTPPLAQPLCTSQCKYQGEIRGSGRVWSAAWTGWDYNGGAASVASRVNNAATALLTTSVIELPLRSEGYDHNPSLRLRAHFPWVWSLATKRDWLMKNKRVMFTVSWHKQLGCGPGQRQGA